MLSIFGHNLMHIITATIAIILFAISTVTYFRNKKPKFLFISAAFLIFAIKEVYLTIATGQTGDDPTSLFSHFLNLVILILFAIGILK